MEFLLNFITLNTLLLYKFYLQWVINIWTITVHMFFITADVVITRESCSSPYHCAIHKDYIVFSPFKFTYMVEKQEKKFMWIFLIILFFFVVIFRIACSWTIIKNLVELSESNVNIYVWHLLLSLFVFVNNSTQIYTEFKADEYFLLNNDCSKLMTWKWFYWQTEFNADKPCFILLCILFIFYLWYY